MFQTSASRSPDVVIVGGGAVGVCSALELARAGASVTLLERGPELAWGCSSGNAGIVGASHVLPLANPEALLDGLRWMGRPDSPFALRPRPQLAPWIARFVRASLPWRVRRAHRVLREMALTSARMHEQLAADGLDTGYTRRGLLNVYASAKTLRTAQRAAAADLGDGLASEVLDGDELRAAFPALAGTPAGGVLYPDEAHCDPRRFVEAVGAAAAEAGVRIRTGVEVLGVRRRGDEVASLLTSRGEILPGQLVVAAGVWSGRLLRDLPVRLPLQGGKGYHVDLGHPAPGLDVPVWFQEARVVVTPLPGRVRVAGTLELAGLDLSVDHRRVQAILDAAHAGVRGLDDRPVADVWRGLRPCSPDGLPIIGRSGRVSNLTVATGHGMWGLQLGPLTGRLVAQIVAERPVDGDLAALAPERFALATATPPAAPAAR